MILIEPGGVKTPIWKKAEQLADEMLPRTCRPRRSSCTGGMIEDVRAGTARIAQESGIEPREVAEAIGTALTASRPRARYLVGRDAKIRGPMAKFLPARVMDRLIGRALGG